MRTPGKHRIAIARTAVRVSAVAAVALLMGTSLGATAATAANTEQCGTILKGTDRYFAIKARGVSCATARKMTSQWSANVNKGGPSCATYKFCHVRGFTCRTPRSKHIDTATDCRRPGARVTWRHGLPLGDCGYTRSCGTSKAIDDGALRL